MAKLLVTGGTGFIGTALVRALRARGDEVTVFTRGSDREAFGVRYLHWEPLAGDAWYHHVDGQDAIVHLAGERAVGVRYTAALKQRLIDSRAAVARRIAEAIERASARPRVLLSQSGVGYYGGTLERRFVDESAGPGSDFLAQLCVEWEAAAAASAELGVRVVITRSAPVLGRGGGALETMTLPFKLFAGGWIASGRQGFPWVHLDDAVGISLCLLDDSVIEGPVNVVAPEAVSNADVSRAIARELRRPCWLPVPAFALKALFGEGAEPLITGQWAVPKVMQDRGYAWKYPELTAALHEALS